jgi:glutamine amidotransferase
MVVVLDFGIKKENSLLQLLNKLDCDYILSKSEQDILNADKLILFIEEDIQAVLRSLHIYNLFSLLRLIKIPLLAIGSGVQLLFDRLLENGSAGLGILKLPDNYENSVDSDEIERDVEVKVLSKDCLFDGFEDTAQFYFDRVNFIPRTDNSTAVKENENECCVAVQKLNYFGVQFHPELSGDTGEKLIRNFLEKC